MNGINGSIAGITIALFDSKWDENKSSTPGASIANTPEGPEAMHEDNLSFPRPFYYASMLGLDKIIRILIDRGDNLNEIEGFCDTSIQAIAYGDHLKAMQWPKYVGVNLDYMSEYYGIALRATAYRAHLDIVI